MNKRQKHLDLAARIAGRHPDLHPWYVAVLACNAPPKADFEALIVGLLHDSLEDGYITTEEFEEFDDLVQSAVRVLTRRDGEKYWAYIARVKKHSGDVGRLARRVKLADATVNLERSMVDFGYESLSERYRRVIKELS